MSRVADPFAVGAPAQVATWGVPVALLVISAWVFTAALGVLALQFSIAAAPLVVLVRALSTTGLFITAHDAMHGLVAPTRPRLNEAIGVLCLGLYAFLPYARLRSAHHEHHRIPAREGDPDFRAAGFMRWFVDFLGGYMSWRIFALNALTFIVLLALGAPVLELLFVWVVPALLSAVQLFTFGTYLPHRPGPGHDDDHRARSADVTPFWSFVSCFHFGYHWEHHDAPWTPWWMLPARRAQQSLQLRALAQR